MQNKLWDVVNKRLGKLLSGERGHGQVHEIEILHHKWYFETHLFSHDPLVALCIYLLDEVSYIEYDGELCNTSDRTGDNYAEYHKQGVYPKCN